MVSVCIYSPSENIWGGGQIYIENLCRYLNDAGVPSAIATAEPASFDCATIRIGSVARKLHRVRAAPSLARSLKRQGVRAIVLNDLSSLWLAPVFRAFGLRVVSLLHLYLQRRNAAGLGHGALQYRLLRWSSRFAHCVFSVNKENVDTFPVKVEFVGNFISDWFFEAPKVDDKFYDLGLIARLSPEKNVLLFVQLVAKLNQRSHRPINAVIVGKGEEELRVRHEIRRLNMQDRIEMRPWVERAELPRIFDQIRCFAITSHHEGFATTLLEAHARGVPAISTRTAGYCAEFVEAFGEHTGLVFEPEDMNSVSFFERLHNLIDNSEHYRSACIRKAKQFSEDSVLGRIREGIVALLVGSKNK